jgi:hypothetical protein
MNMKLHFPKFFGLKLSHGCLRTVLSVTVLSTAATVVLTACTVYQTAPPGPILSRLPPDAPGAVPYYQTPELTEQENQRYDQLDRQVQREQNRAIENETNPPWAGYYAAPPVVVYGGYSHRPWRRGSGWGYPAGGYPYYGGWGW